jgi:hypothetical protein
MLLPPNKFNQKLKPMLKPKPKRRIKKYAKFENNINVKKTGVQRRFSGVEHPPNWAKKKGTLSGSL